MLLQYVTNFDSTLAALLTTVTLGKSKLTIMWADAQRDGRPANTGGALCRSSVIPCVEVW